MKIIDKLGKIDEKYIEKAVIVDDNEKFKEEKMKKNNKENIKFNGKLVFVPVACLCLVMVALISLETFDVFSNKKLSANSNRYLTADYTLMMYESANDYIYENINLDSLKVNETITITDDDLFDKIDEQYKKCSGKIIITKNKYNIYEHDIETSCDNEAKNNIDLTLKVYTNTNQNSEYQIIRPFDQTSDGYSGVLSNYIVSKDETGASYRYNGVSGIIDFTNDLNIKKINIFNKKLDGMGTSLRKQSNGYLLEYKLGDDSNDYEVVYYDSDLNSIWSKKNEFNIQNILYETEDNIIFNNFEYELDNGTNKLVEKVFSIDKKDGSVEYQFTLKKDDASNVWCVGYGDEILYGYDCNNVKIIYLYDLDGNLIKTVSTKDFYEKKVPIMPVVSVSKDIILIEENNVVYVVDGNGKLVDTIKLENVSGVPELQLVINDKYYEIIYNLDSQSDNKELISYSRYNLKHELIFNEHIDLSYGYSTLKNMGLSFQTDVDLDYKASVFNGKIIENIYFPDNNGTIVMMMFDYNNSTNIEEAVTTYGDVNDDGTVNGKDMTIIQKYIEGSQTLTEKQKKAADVNLDEKVTEDDVTIIRKYITGGLGVDKLPYIS